MSSTRAFWLFFTRTPVKWAVPLIVVLTFFDIWNRRTIGVTTWPRLTAELASGQTLVAIAFIGIGAWRGYRERAPGLTDLMRTTSRPLSLHLILAWLSVVVWALISYILVIGLVSVVLGTRTTWGGPDVWIIVAATSAIVAAASIGFLLGTVFPYVFTAPLLAIGWWALDGYVALMSSSAKYLVPRSLFENSSLNIFRQPWPASLAHWQTLLWITVAIACASVLVLRSVPFGAIAIVIHTALVIVIAVALTGLLRIPSNLAPRSSPPPRSVTLACEDQQGFEICVHPANARLLDDAAVTIKAMMMPLHGVPGAPSKAEERTPENDSSGPSVLLFSIGDRSSVTFMLAAEASINLVTGNLPSRVRGPFTLTLPQAIIATWLLNQAGFNGSETSLGVLTQEARIGPSQAPNRSVQGTVDEEVERFSSLSDDNRHAWLASHWTSIQDGSLTTEQLP